MVNIISFVRYYSSAAASDTNISLSPILPYIEAVATHAVAQTRIKKGGEGGGRREQMGESEIGLGRALPL